MLALTLQQGHPLLLTDAPRPIPAPGEALLRLRLAGICGTDLAMTAGYKPGFGGVLGHEYVAEVAAAPDHPDWVGRRVVGEINTACGTCAHCRAGLTTHCQQRRILGMHAWDGVFAEYFLSPIALLHPLPADLPDEIAVFTEPTAAAFAILRDLPADAGERAAVFGDGRLGQLSAQVLRAAGYDPLLIGRHAGKLAIAQALGLRTAAALPPGLALDFAVDATGRAEACADILKHLRPRGVLILKSTAAQPASLDLARIVVNELRVIGSRCGPFAPAIAALHSGQVDPRPLISARYALAQAAEALAHARRQDALKVLLHP